MTRWATGDIAGRLMQMLDEQKRKYKLISKKAYNPETGKMLNPSQLNKEQYDLLLHTYENGGEAIVRANYDQEPVDIQGKLYKNFLTYNPADIQTIDNPDGKIVFREIRARADVADQRWRLFVYVHIWSNGR